MDKISIVVPCYDEEKAIPLFYSEIEKVVKDFENVEFEYIFVDDGSKDDTLSVIKDLESRDEKIRYISFSRNFGKEAAMLAGFENANGDYIAVMDVDLQDPPSLLKEMYQAIKQENFDCVATRRVTRKGEPAIRSAFSRMFYKLINKMTDVEIVDGARDYRLMTAQVKDAIVSMKEYNRFSKGLFPFVGFKTKWIEYENVERVAGESKWSFWKLFKYALEGITAFTTTPLTIAAVVGFLFCLVSGIAIIFIIIKTLVFGDSTSGWPSLACIVMFMGGIQLLSLGIIGQYLAKAYLEVKDRPIYIIKEQDNN